MRRRRRKSRRRRRTTTTSGRVTYLIASVRLLTLGSIKREKAPIPPVKRVRVKAITETY
jgi:hypothetical protein